LMLLQIKLSNFQIPSVIKKDYRLLECWYWNAFTRSTVLISFKC
jgi:hypothetical protein